MTELNQALLDIESIRRQVAESTEFRGYGPVSLSLTAVAALLAGAAQSHWVADPASHPEQFVALWLTTGFCCAALILAEMLIRAKRVHSGMANEMMQTAVMQFLPAAVAGVLLPLILLHVAGGVLWMLPGLWQLLFSLGVFASCRCLPRPMTAVGGWFLLTGLVSVALGSSRALAPATMACPFAVGMSLVAAIHGRSARRSSFEEGVDE